MNKVKTAPISVIKNEIAYYENILFLTRRAKVGMGNVFDLQEDRLISKINELKQQLKNSKPTKQRRNKKRT